MDCYEGTIVLMTSSPRMPQDSSEMHLNRMVEANDSHRRYSIYPT